MNKETTLKKEENKDWLKVTSEHSTEQLKKQYQKYSIIYITKAELWKDQ